MGPWIGLPPRERRPAIVFRVGGRDCREQHDDEEYNEQKTEQSAAQNELVQQEVSEEDCNQDPAIGGEEPWVRCEVVAVSSQVAHRPRLIIENLVRRALPAVGLGLGEMAGMELLFNICDISIAFDPCGQPGPNVAT